MLHILLVILKFIGILLAAVLGFVFFLALLVLLAPIRYKACGEVRDGKPFFLLNVSWLFVVLRGRVAYMEEGLLFGLRIFGFLLFSNDEEFRKKKEEKAKRRKRKKEKKELPAEEEAKDKQEEKSLGKEGESRKEEEPGKEDESGKEEELRTEEELGKEEEPRKEDESGKEEKQEQESGRERAIETIQERDGGADIKTLAARWKKKVRQIVCAVRRLRDKIWGFKDKITLMKDKIEAFFGKIDQLREKASRIKEFWDREGTKKAKIRLLKDGKAILLHLLPRKCRGKVSFGFDDPVLMGNILAVLGLLMPLYQDRLIVEPYFEETKFFGEFSLKGRIIPGYLLMKGLFLLLDKNIRKTIKEVKQLIGGN